MVAMLLLMAEVGGEERLRSLLFEVLAFIDLARLVPWLEPQGVIVQGRLISAQRY